VRKKVAQPLDEYAENVTKEAIDGNLDPVIGVRKKLTMLLLF
jgi:ATP-dependent Clp protease ATP-binding subunit ClpA